MDHTQLPTRLNVKEVCRLAGGTDPISVSTLDRRIRAGTLPRPIDRGRSRLFDKAAVLKALRMDDPAPPDQDRTLTLEEFQRARAALTPKRKGRPR